MNITNRFRLLYLSAIDVLKNDIAISASDNSFFEIKKK